MITLRRSLCLLVLCAVGVGPRIAVAQSTCAIPVEAWLTDLAGAPADANVDIEVTFYDGPGEGAASIDCRRALGVDVSEGWLRFSLDACSLPEPGPSGCGVMPITEILERGATEAGAVWMGLRIGEDVDELSPRLELGAVPYAVRAGLSTRALTADAALICEEADYAVAAGTADYASEAGNAATADAATTAGTADYASEAGNAATADAATTAGTADYASEAGNAATADAATTAGTADFASEAGNAATADAATTAGTADFASEAGNAATADAATTAGTADFASEAGNAATADAATTAGTADFASEAGNAATADRATSAARADVADALAGFDPDTVWREGDPLTQTLDAAGNRIVDVRGETYNVWGTTTCAAGDDRLYTGRIGAVVGTGGASTTICLDDGMPSSGWQNWHGGMIWRAQARIGVRGQYSNGPNNFVCAVCEGNVYVNWGVDRCASGYSTVYSGWMASFSGGWGNGWSPGSALCLSTAASGTWVDWNDTMVMRSIGSGGDNRVQFQDNQDMRCRVCY